MVNQANNFGNTALHEASRWNNQTLVAILLKHNAAVNIQNKQRLTALQLAQVYIGAIPFKK